MTPKQKAWAIQAEHVIKQMERRHFNAYYCSTKEEALSKALSIIEKGAVIASGGSATIEEVGLLNYIKTHSEEYTRPFVRNCNRKGVPGGVFAKTETVGEAFASPTVRLLKNDKMQFCE